MEITLFSNKFKSSVYLNNELSLMVKNKRCIITKFISIFHHRLNQLSKIKCDNDSKRFLYEIFKDKYISFVNNLTTIDDMVYKSHLCNYINANVNESFKKFNFPNNFIFSLTREKKKHEPNVRYEKNNKKL